MIFELFPRTGKSYKNTVDIFPRTENIHKNHYRPIPEKGQKEKHRLDIKMSLSCHVETVVLMSRVWQGRGRKQRQPRLRIYGNKYFLSELTEVLSAEVGALPKKVQKATNKSEVSGILYYTSRAEVERIVSYLYQPETKYFNKGRYEEFQDILIQFQNEDSLWTKASSASCI